jgi:ADP-ribosylglycohydrolase
MADNKKKERFIATFVLHAVGDMIGFKNGEWEFNFFKPSPITLDLTYELFFDYISLGGIIGIDFSDWVVSDDTLLHMAIGEALLLKPEVSPELYSIVKTKLKDKYQLMLKFIREKSNRYYGLNTEKYILKFSNEVDGRTLPYDIYSGGSGASMRTSCIGLAFYGKQNRSKLIDVAIETSRTTHNSAIGYLGGLVAALFVSFAIENINVDEWPRKLLDVLQSDHVQKYITNDDIKSDHSKFKNLWRKYIEIKKLSSYNNKDNQDNKENKDNPDKKLTKNLIYRSKFHYDNFSREFEIESVIGANGCTSVIMAYDCLLDAGDKWETLVVYSALHIGDSDTVASIACSWFGALYGFKSVPKSNYSDLEFKKELFDLGEVFYTKFN